MNKKNKLAFEKSEYLLQHSTNPVNWYPWSEEIFRLSKNLNKPIFLSIGYSSCHWCHVMERESFEDKFTADILNKNFISVKVDREERPDIDSLYMAAVQMISGSGGWPATLFLNENGIPFFAGTYFPPKANSHYPSFTEVLAKVTEIYSRDKDNINKQVELVYENLKKYFEQNSIQKINVHNLYDKMSDEIKNIFDYENGGFGTHPKFPEVSKLEILFKLNKRYNNDDYLDMAQLSLGSMITGGLFDQLRGGFSRYSTDRAWKIPHFEKMLYDNGLLIRLLSISYQITKNKEILINIKQNISFLLKEMKNDQNLFFSSQDADSDGEEGKFYLWDYHQLEKILSKDEFTMVKQLWDITIEGDLDGKNILTIKSSIKDLSEKFNKDQDSINKSIELVKSKMISYKEKEIKPNIDKKIILSWNSLVISGLCKSYDATGNQMYLDQAEYTTHSIMKNLSKEKTLFHTIGYSQSFLEDYSYFTRALLDLYTSTLSTKWYHLAKSFCDETIENFWDGKEKVFFDTTEISDLFLRPRSFFDPMIPNAAAIAASNCYKLYRMNNEQKYFSIVNKSIEKVSPILTNSPLDTPNWFLLYSELHEDNIDIVFTGDRESNYFLEAKKLILATYIPNSIIVANDLDDNSFDSPLFKGRTNNINTTVYLCKNNVCNLPADDIESLEKQINNEIGAGI